VSAELAIMPVYLIDQKGAYDTDRLVVSGELLFPVELSNKVPDSIEDIRQATKCLAFELPSACGFHLHRASEAILRIYFDSLTNSAPRPKSRNIGDYLNELDKLGVGDKQTKSALRDLKRSTSQSAYSSRAFYRKYRSSDCSFRQRSSGCYEYAKSNTDTTATCPATAPSWIWLVSTETTKEKS
jgi:hypothetical protein